MPDIIIIFFNSPVRREESGLCDIDQSSAAPVFLICGVVSHCLLFTYHIGVEIRKSLEPVFPDQFILETFQMFLIAEGEHFFAGEEVNRTTKVRVCLVPVFCTVITDCIAVDDLFATLTKDIDVVVSDCFGDLHVCTVHGSESQGTVQHEFHVSCSGCLFGSKADLLREIAGRDHHFSSRDVVVFYKDELHPFGNFRVILDHLRKCEQSVDDVFGDNVRRSCLGTEDADQRNAWYMAGFDLQILMDQEQKI